MDESFPSPPSQSQAVGGRIGAATDRALAVVAVLAIAGIVVWAVTEHGPDPRQWEWFHVSGVLVLAACLIANRGQDERTITALRRLVGQGVIPAEDREGAVRRVAYELSRHWWAPAVITSVAFMAVIVLLWLLAYRQWSLDDVWFWIEILLAALAGIAVGRMIARGSLGAAITRAGLTIAPIPGHVDGAAGLRPVGYLYLRQATIVAALTLYAGFWWLMFPAYAELGHRYMNWRDPYLLLMIIGIVAEILVCVLPLWRFHKIMAATKATNARSADQYATRITLLKDERRRSDEQSQQRIDAEISTLSSEWADLENMPVWPVDARVRRRFTINNVVVFLPIVLNIIAPGGWWEDVIQALMGMKS